MYKILSEISFFIRCYLCYLTIDNILILSNQLLNYVLLEVFSLYTILRIITYLEVGTIYKKSDESEIGVIVYFFIYLINLGIMYVLLLILTHFGILPI